jgi:hypothetical protein
MFLKIHQEGLIAYKQLTEADLGRSAGHTTHIGLFGKVLTFLPDRDVEDVAIFIHENKSDNVQFFFDRISRNNGAVNSPKIKTGGRKVISVTSLIRDIVSEKSNNLKWYLIWFGLESEKVVFLLFSKESEDFLKFSNLINLSDDLVKNEVSSKDNVFPKLIELIESKLNKDAINLLEELETEITLGFSGDLNKKFKPLEIDKMLLAIKEVGRRGEELVNNYFEYQKFKKQIANYVWYNKSKESGLPYDFHFQPNNQQAVYLDVKSTSFSFEQKMIFSSQEVKFINRTPNQYNIFRVYDLGETSSKPKLKICQDSRKISEIVIGCISELESNLSKFDIEVQSSKLIIPSTHSELKFDREIILDFPSPK